MKSVLVIDDDPRFCALIAAALRTLEAIVVIASSGSEGSAEMSRREFDLVVLDGRLPDDDGISWLQRLRQKNCSIPVIFVSASYRDTDSYARLYSELNVVAVIQKPVQIQQLLYVAREVLQSAAPESAQGSFDLLGEEFDELVKEYQAGLPRALNELKQYLLNLQDYKHVDDSYTAAISIAHMIRGTSGSYGLKNLSNLMVAIEENLRAMQAKGMPTHVGCKSLINCVDAATLDVCPEFKAVPAQKQSLCSTAIHVLVLDDDQFFLKRIEHLCSSAGMSVTSFSDTRQLASVLDHANPDIILLDLNMPDKNGFNVCEEVRRMERWKQIPIVVVTAETFPVVESASLQLGATQFVAKPINSRQLIDMIRELIPNRQIAANTY